MFNFNIFAVIFKKNEKLDDENNELIRYNFSSKMRYIKAKYPNCPNSDYIKLMDIEKEKIKNMRI